MFRFGFWVNGGPGIGMGHISRCIALADELKKYGCNLSFVSMIPDGIKAIQAAGYAVIYPVGTLLSTSSNILEISSLLYGFLKTNFYDLLLVDSYDVTFRFLITLKSMVGKLAYIDDLNAFPYPVDLLINGNANVEKLEYQKISSREILLVGTEYNLIRQEFRNLPVKKPRDGVKNILITSGSTDDFHMCFKISQMILSDEGLADLRLKIIIGPGFIDFGILHNLAQRYPAVTLCHNPESMSKLILDSDMAVSAAGSTLYELCACGVPALSYIIAANQSGLAEYMDEQGLIKSMGWHNKLNKKNICSSIKVLASDKNKRTAISSAMRRLVDGYGTKRAAERIVEMMSG